MSTSQRAVMPCGWGVKAGMVVCGLQVKLCDPLVTRGPYLSALEIRNLYIKRYINSPSLLLQRLYFAVVSGQRLLFPRMSRHPAVTAAAAAAASATAERELDRSCLVFRLSRLNLTIDSIIARVSSVICLLFRCL